MTPPEEQKPQAIDISAYTSLLTQDFQYLLNYRSDNETAFQQFMEMNPCLVPGSKAELTIGSSVYGPERQVLVAQPKLQGIINRQPDFMWLAFDSINFTPVLVKIEAPSRKYFTEDGTVTAEFSRAKNQLDEWTVAMSRPENVLHFYDAYDISANLRKLIFKPLYLLIYGRTSEYENSTLLKSKVSSLLDKSCNQHLISFDLIVKEVQDRNFITAVVSDGKFQAKYLAPTFKIGPDEIHLLGIDGLVDAASRMGYATDERKAFLKKRIPYWINKIGESSPRKMPAGIREITRPLE